MSTVWAFPFSLAATKGIDVSFYSSRYLDVSVPLVAFRGLWIQHTDTGALPPAGFPIRKSSDYGLVSGSPKLIAATPRPSSAPGTKASTMHP